MYGFLVYGLKLLERVFDMVYKEVEKCDRFGGFLILMSLVGGIGFGVGVYIIECFWDEFLYLFILN